MGMKLPETRTVPIDTVTPYDQNPRHISDEAVAAVRDSIDNYGYVQPILVDSDMVIVAGHTRYRALKELGHETVEVLVADHLTPNQARQYRLIDNRTAELTDWAHEDLVAELRLWEENLIQAHFPNIDLGLEKLKKDELTQKDVDRGALEATNIKKASELHTTGVLCPSCHATFPVRTSTLPHEIVGQVYPDMIR